MNWRRNKLREDYPDFYRDFQVRSVALEEQKMRRLSRVFEENLFVIRSLRSVLSEDLEDTLREGPSSYRELSEELEFHEGFDRAINALDRNLDQLKYLIETVHSARQNVRIIPFLEAGLY